MSLTGGALARIFAGEKVLTPNLQILGYKKINGSGMERFRILLSDGEFSYSLALLGAKLIPMMHAKQLEQFTIFNLKAYTVSQSSPCQSVIMAPPASQVPSQSNKRVLVLSEMSIVKLGSQVKEKIGNPVPLGSDEQVYSGFNLGEETGVLQGASNDRHKDSNVEKKPCVLKEPTNDQVGSKLEDVRANVRNQYIGEIDKINENIKHEEMKMDRNEVINKKEMKDLEEKHEWEKYVLKRKFEQESDSMNERHRDEMTTLKAKIQKCEDTTILENLKGSRSQMIKDLNKLDNCGDEARFANSQRNLEAAQGKLECPICMEPMKPPKRIWMCPSSHLICEPCKDRLNVMPCPTCRTERVTQRAFMAEDFARAIFTDVIE